MNPFGLEHIKVPVKLKKDQKDQVIDRTLRILREEVLGGVVRINSPDQPLLTTPLVVETRYLEVGRDSFLDVTSVSRAIEQAVLELVGFQRDYKRPTLRAGMMREIAQEVMGVINNTHIRKKISPPPHIAGYVATEIIKNEDTMTLYLYKMQRLCSEYQQEPLPEKKTHIFKLFHQLTKGRTILQTKNNHLNETYNLSTGWRDIVRPSNNQHLDTYHVDIPFSASEHALSRYLPKNLSDDDSWMANVFSWKTEKKGENTTDITDFPNDHSCMLYTLLYRKICIFMYAGEGQGAGITEKRKSDDTHLSKLEQEISDITGQIDALMDADTEGNITDMQLQVCNDLEISICKIQNEYLEGLLKYFDGNAGKKSGAKNRIAQTETHLMIYYDELSRYLSTFNFESRYIHRGELPAEFHDTPTIDDYVRRANFFSQLIPTLQTPLSLAEEGLAKICLPGKNLFTRFLAQPGAMMLDDIGIDDLGSEVDHMKNIEEALSAVLIRKLAVFFHASEYQKKHPDNKTVPTLLSQLSGEIRSLRGYIAIMTNRIDWIQGKPQKEVTQDLMNERDFFAQERLKLFEEFFTNKPGKERIFLGEKIIKISHALQERRNALYDRGISHEVDPYRSSCEAERMTSSENDIYTYLSADIYAEEERIFGEKVAYTYDDRLTREQNGKNAIDAKLKHALERKLFLFFHGAKMIYDIQIRMSSGDTGIDIEIHKKEIAFFNTSLSHLGREIISLRRILREDAPEENTELIVKHKQLWNMVNHFSAQLDGLMAHLPYFGIFSDKEQLNIERELLGLYISTSVTLDAIKEAIFKGEESGTDTKIKRLVGDLGNAMQGILEQTDGMSGELADILDPHPARVHDLRALARKIQEEISVYAQG